MIFENLDGHDLVGASLPALGNLAEGAAAEELQYLIAVGDRAEDFVLHQLVVTFTV